MSTSPCVRHKKWTTSPVSSGNRTRAVLVLFLVLLFPSLVFSAEPAVVSVTVNHVPQGEFFVTLTEDKDFLIKPGDLKAMGFKEPAGKAVAISGETFLSLRSMKGVEFQFNLSTLTLQINASPDLLISKQVLDFTPQQQGEVYYPRGRSAFLNYGISYHNDDSANNFTFNVANQLGIRTGDFLFLTDSTYTRTKTEENFVRLMSNLTYDGRQEMLRVVAGDFFAASGTLGSSVNMGGLSYSKIFGINPYFIKNPLFDYSGMISLPSDAEIYMNGAYIRTVKLSPGEFELKNLPLYGGANTVEVVLKDAFGKEQHILYPFYSSDVLLKRGLHEYSYNTGFLRKNFGTESNEYGGAAFSAFHRYGLNNAVTVGLSGEAAERLYMFGPEMSLLLPSAGVVTAAGARSESGGETGYAGLLRHVYQRKEISTRLFVQGFSRDYTTINGVSFADIRSVAGAGVGFGTRQLGTINIDYSMENKYRTQNRQVGTISYSRNVAKNATVLATYRNIREGETEHEFFVLLTYSPEKNLYVSGRYEQGKDKNAEALQVQKSPPVGEGLGYSASVERTEQGGVSTYSVNPFLQYNTRYGIYTGEYRAAYRDADSAHSYQLTASGSVVYVGNTVGFTRPVYDSFGLVRSGDVQGVRVYLNNQEIGKTDDSGKVFVPNLISYQNNNISIDDRDIPVDYSLSKANRYVSPALRSGSCIYFGATRIQPLMGMLKVKSDNRTVPVEFAEVRMEIDGRSVPFVTGSGGEFYVEGIPSDSGESEGAPHIDECAYAKTNGRIKPGVYKASFDFFGKTCAFSMQIPSSHDPMIDLGEIICETAPSSEGSAPTQGTETTPSHAHESAPEEKQPVFVMQFPFPKGAPSADDHKIISEILTQLKDNPGFKVEIEVHTDRRGSDALNMKFGMKRALRMKKYLKSNGVKERQFKGIVSFGKRKPLCLEPTKECDRMNRRAEIRLAPVPPVQIDKPMEYIIPFPFEKGVPPDADLRTTAEIAQLLNVYPNLRVEIEGHTDAAGPDSLNMRVGLRRAHMMKKLLMSAGVEEKRIKRVISYGKKKLLCTSPVRECDSTNRRIVIRLVPDKAKSSRPKTGARTR